MRTNPKKTQKKRLVSYQRQGEIDQTIDLLKFERKYGAKWTYESLEDQLQNFKKDLKTTKPHSRERERGKGVIKATADYIKKFKRSK